MGQSGFASQLEAFLRLMMTPIGALGVLVLVGLIIALTIKSELKWLVLSVMLWTSLFSFYTTEFHLTVPMAAPLEQIRGTSRPICIALLIALLAPAFLSRRGWRFHPLSAAALAY